MLPAFDNSVIDAFPVGSDILIIQDYNIFRGWVVKPPKNLNGIERVTSLSGATYTSRTQKIIVTESYTDKTVDYIVKDIFTKYVPWATVNNVKPCSDIITIKFADEFIWDAMERLCKLSSFEWYIDENLDVNFFDKMTQINPIILSQEDGNYKRGTANFTPDASKLVNKLWVKGGKALSLPFTQNITVSPGTPIPLFYSPREPVYVTIGGESKTVGIQNVDAAGTKDFLLNAAEKLLVPDLCVIGDGVITYRYEYPIKILLEDKISQSKYGVFEDIYPVDTDDKILARALGVKYLSKYSNPVTTGSIQPMDGLYKAGELIKIEIPDLSVDDYFQIKQVQNDSVPGMHQVNITLQLETPEKDLPEILKGLDERLRKLENTVYKNSAIETTVEQYRNYSDTKAAPRASDGGITYVLHQYKLCGPSLICGTTQYI